ncbi:MAG: UDP-N-acetylmuramate dehydrogenase [Tissierellia bacterium]|nr:UDP-N-acetylmuramate dehydrogenase [Tissierellia bacterium]
MNKELIDKVLELGIEDVLLSEEMKNHTTFKIGGPADILIKPKNEEEVRKVLEICKNEQIPYFVKGNGSNILVRDKGIRGIVIEFSEKFSDVKIDDNRVTAQSGALLSTVSKKSFQESLAGMEAVSGIPASVGGAMAMNAGAYGTEMKDIVESVRLMDSNGQIHEYSNEEMHFRYRASRVGDDKLVVLSATFKLNKDNYDDIMARFEDYDFRRKDKQPLSDNSAGSTFKRPEGHYASALIDQAGLRGFTHGRAKVSDKHCGFLINIDNSTCENLLELVKKVQDSVNEKYGVNLEMEVKIIGEE